ncbi:MAG: hypothetical protein K9J37_14430 [Saprospiraceae bacterium]|nr:hypothetical protein [Saprospiraceae bacterium]MCF8251104.1 hypothetical protein [Saprospiraceae bacterium]MCF8281006.1 hypothetical protein [Bacteroidales bacterium]MCF8312938.1 hypothetical protein [Saprospiraceae bacterium]MCF8441363.1 hypothetical protein [Saprospiraceae bacterium]
MKNGFLRFAFVASLAMVLVLPGCKKEDTFTLAKCLSSTDWNATSFRIDGHEYIGINNYYSSLQLEFGQYNKADQRGSITMTRILSSGSVEPPYTGTYEIIESTQEIDITFNGFATTTFMTDCTEQGRLNLEGNIIAANGINYYWEINTRKK